MAKLLKAQLSVLHRRERKLLAKANVTDSDVVELNRRAMRLRKKAREVIFLA